MMKIALALVAFTAISFHVHERRPEYRQERSPPVYYSEPYYAPAPDDNGADSDFYRRYHEFDTPDDAQ
jgi:hypothetical protein